MYNKKAISFFWFFFFFLWGGGGGVSDTPPPRSYLFPGGILDSLTVLRITAGTNWSVSAIPVDSTK